jgi:creatinine amidohydrolase
MDLPVECFSPERWPFTISEQTLAYQKLLLHVLAEADSLGFHVGVLVAGHYPLVDHARAAAILWNQRTVVRRRGRMLAWAFVDYLLVADQFDGAGDHAGGWETSHMLAIDPETVDLSRLPPRGEKIIGAGGRMAPQDATAEFGRKTLDAAADAAIREVRHRLENPKLYFAHGCSQREGLWRTGGRESAGSTPAGSGGKT